MSDSEKTTRWWQRAVPVTVLAAGALTAGVLALPEQEVELSTARKPQPFVELFLTERPQESCQGDSLRFRVVSHLERPRALRYRITVDPAGQSRAAVVERGKVRLAPGQAKTRRVERLGTRAGAHDLTLRLEKRPEQLRIHCGGES